MAWRRPRYDVVAWPLGLRDRERTVLGFDGGISDGPLIDRPYPSASSASRRVTLSYIGHLDGATQVFVGVSAQYTCAQSLRVTLSYIGHLDGATQVFVGASINPGLARKVTFFGVLHRSRRLAARTICRWCTRADVRGQALRYVRSQGAWATVRISTIQLRSEPADSPIDVHHADVCTQIVSFVADSDGSWHDQTTATLW